MHLLRPSASALRTVAPQLGHAFSVGAVNLAAATALNTRLAESSQGLEEFAKNPVVPLAFEDFAQDARNRQPAARRDRARAGQLQLLDAGVPQPREPGVGEHRRGHGRPREHRAVAVRPQQRGLPRLGDRQRPRHRKEAVGNLDDHPQQPPALQPLPERHRPRPAGRVRSGQRGIRAGQSADRQRDRRRQTTANSPAAKTTSPAKSTRKRRSKRSVSPPPRRRRPKPRGKQVKGKGK